MQLKVESTLHVYNINDNIST